MLISSKRSRSSLPRGRGFTLIELLLVLSVMTILTAVFLLQQQRFDSSTLLRSLAYSIALSVRQAQVYGTSVREFDGTFDTSYGLYFNSSTPGSYVLFADINKNGSYDPATENLKTFTLGSKFAISDICAVEGSARSCATGGVNGGTQIQWLTIYFTRPNPDARFKTEDGVDYSSAYIQIIGKSGATRSVDVSLTGQITVGAVGT